MPTAGSCIKVAQLTSHARFYACMGVSVLVPISALCLCTLFAIVINYAGSNNKLFPPCRWLAIVLYYYYYYYYYYFSWAVSWFDLGALSNKSCQAVGYRCKQVFRVCFVFFCCWRRRQQRSSSKAVSELSDLNTYIYTYVCIYFVNLCA